MITLCCYIKNILIFFVVFFFPLRPAKSILTVTYLQTLGTLAVFVRFDASSRRSWVPLCQELFPGLYFFVYSVTQGGQAGASTRTCS